MKNILILASVFVAGAAAGVGGTILTWYLQMRKIMKDIEVIESDDAIGFTDESCNGNCDQCIGDCK